MPNPQEDFRVAILAALGHAPEMIEPGRFHRFGTSGRRADDAGWCKLFDDLRGGVFGCYRQGMSGRWNAADREPTTQEERTIFARQAMLLAAKRKLQQRRQWEANANRIDRMWAQCVPLVPGRFLHPVPEAARIQ